MFKVDAPGRISTPGHSTSGADAIGDAGWVTPGFALENKLEMRPPNQLSDDPTLDADEQPDSAMAVSSNIAARRSRLRSSSCPGRIEITRLLPAKSPLPMSYTNETVATPRRFAWLRCTLRAKRSEQPCSPLVIYRRPPQGSPLRRAYSK